MKRQNIYKGHTKDLSEFSHRYACWANRRNQWAKAKAKNERIAKKGERRQLQKEIMAIYD